jgi:hypothetical protein
MEGNNSPFNKKYERQIPQVIKLKFLILFNFIEFIYDFNKKVGGVELKVILNGSLINYMLFHV